MTISESLVWATQQLEQSESARLDAEVLLAHILTQDRIYLVAHSTDTLTPDQRHTYETMIQQRADGRPVAYLTGHKEFHGLDFVVTPAVLIPRPETELAVDAVLQMAADKPNAQIADVGTGSGAIAVTLKKLLPQATVFASDISSEALAVARANATHHHVSINWGRGDLLAPFEDNQLDIIVANLPYLDPRWMTQRELSFEPREALVAEDGGLETIKRFLEALTANQPTATALLEIDPRQEHSLRDAAARLAPHHLVVYAKDASGLTRLALLVPR